MPVDGYGAQGPAARWRAAGRFGAGRCGPVEIAEEGQHQHDGQNDETYEYVQPVEAGEREEAGAEDAAFEGDLFLDQMGVFAALADEEDRAEDQGDDEPGF